MPSSPSAHPSLTGIRGAARWNWQRVLQPKWLLHRTWRAAVQTMYEDLTDFLADLEKRKLLVRIAEAVSPDLEIAAVTDRASKMAGGGPALLFEHPTGSNMP